MFYSKCCLAKSQDHLRRLVRSRGRFWLRTGSRNKRWPVESPPHLFWSFRQPMSRLRTPPDSTATSSETSQSSKKHQLRHRSPRGQRGRPRAGLTSTTTTTTAQATHQDGTTTRHRQRDRSSQVAPQPGQWDWAWKHRRELAGAAIAIVVVLVVSVRVTRSPGLQACTVDSEI